MAKLEEVEHAHHTRHEMLVVALAAEQERHAAAREQMQAIGVRRVAVAAAESPRAGFRATAAVKVQAAFRGLIVRQQMLAMLEAELAELVGDEDSANLRLSAEPAVAAAAVVAGHLRVAELEAAMAEQEIAHAAEKAELQAVTPRRLAAIVTTQAATRGKLARRAAAAAVAADKRAFHIEHFNRRRTGSREKKQGQQAVKAAAAADTHESESQ